MASGSGCGCKDVYTVFTLLIRGGKLNIFLTDRELLQFCSSKS